MKLLVALSIVSIACSTQFEPIPGGMEGFSMGPTRTNYTIDVYYDHLCPDSAAAWEGLQKYFHANQYWLRVVIHIFPLPYHTFSFVVSQAGRFIQDNYPDDFISYLDFMFDHRSKYLDTALFWTMQQIKNNIAADASSLSQATFSEVLNALESDSVNNEVRVGWKYGCSHGVSGTPIHFVNGVMVPDATAFTTEEAWAHFFYSLNATKY